MMKLLVLTDDFTGALDTGAQFVKSGAKTCVTTDAEILFGGVDADVLVIDTETRHKGCAEAFRIISGIGKRAADAGVQRIYKKTDSALRGNIGAELDALMTGCRLNRLAFMPAFPKLKRYTSGGTHYIGQEPVSESVFGDDPFEPVTESFIPNAIHSQSSRPVFVSNAERFVLNPEGITVFDAVTDSELVHIADVLCALPGRVLMAGCAGFAEFLAQDLFSGQAVTQPFVYSREALIVSGSLNPITLRQLRMAKLRRIPSVTLAPVFKAGAVEDMSAAASSIMEQLSEKGILILETVDSDYPLIKNGELLSADKDQCMNTSDIISANLGKLLSQLTEKGFRGTVVVTGGDTLMGVVSEAKAFEITLLTEIEPGVILSLLKLDGSDLTIVSKSGGIGSDQVFLNIIDYVNRCAIKCSQTITA